MEPVTVVTRAAPGVVLFTVAVVTLAIAAAVAGLVVVEEGRLVGVLILGPMLLVVCAAVVAFAWITTTADGRGLTVRYGPTPMRTFVPAQQIRAIRVESLRPLRWGGWGYRGSRRIFKAAAILLRGGEGITVELTDGTTLSVSTDRAEEVAARLRTLLDASRGGGWPA